MTREERIRAARLAQARARQRAIAQPNAMGFPAEPAGGSSVNPQAAAELGGKMQAGAVGLINGASFGFADEAMGVTGGIGSLVRGDGWSSGYTNARDDVRRGMDATREAEPMAYGAANLAGAAIPAIAASPLATGGRLLTTVGRGAAIGGAEGALQGAGNADGEGLMRPVTQGAMIGAGAGAAAPALIGGAAAVARSGVMDPLTGLLNVGNAGKAQRAVGSAIRSAGKTPDDLARMIRGAAQEGQPEFRMMDALGLAGQRQASGITRAGGDAATELAEFLQRRQGSQGERVGSFVEDAFGVGGTTAAQTRDGLTAARGQVANAAYDAARTNAAPVDVRGALAAIDDRIGGMQGSGVTGDGIDSKLSGYRSRLAAQPGPDGVNRELSDFDRVLGVKQAVQDDIGAAVRAGRNNEARELGKLATELDAALEGASDGYRAANDGFREASRVIGAVDEGAAMSARGRAADNVPAFQAMNPEMQSAARVGYGDDLLNRLERVTAPTANRAKPLQSMKRDPEAAAMATDYPLYSSRLQRENTMWETQNRALGGSRTADNMADQSAMTDLAGGALGVARSAGNLQFGDVAAKIGAMIGPLMKGQNEGTRSLIAKALMSDDPIKTLAPVLRQQEGNTRLRRMIEAAIRQPMREGVEASFQ